MPLSVLYFTATWCAPCNRIKPIVQRARNDYPEIVWVTVDVDELPDLAAEYDIRSVPTFIALRGEEVVARSNGIGSEAALTLFVAHAQEAVA